MTWRARFCGLVAILFLRTGDAFRAIERATHRGCYALVIWLCVLVGVKGIPPRPIRWIFYVDVWVRGVCAPATLTAYRWCNWWRARCLVAQQLQTPGAPANVKGIGAWVAKQR